MGLGSYLQCGVRNVIQVVNIRSWAVSKIRESGIVLRV